MHLTTFLRSNQLVAARTVPYSLQTLAAAHIAGSTTAALSPAAKPWHAQQGTTRQHPSAMNHRLHLSAGWGQRGLCTLHSAAPPSLLQKLGAPCSSASTQAISHLQQLVGSRVPPRLHSSIRSRSTSASVRAPAAAAEEAKFLSSLSPEQRAAVLAQEQHVRVIAGEHHSSNDCCCG
jgi:hypothetical protein